MGSETEPPPTWTDVMMPHIRRFEVAAKFGKSAVYNPTGSAAMAKLIRKMAAIIDAEVDRRNAPLPPPPGELT